MSYFQHHACFAWNILLRQEIEHRCRLDKASMPPSGKVHHPGVGVKRLVRATDRALYVHIITVCSRTSAATPGLHHVFISHRRKKAHPDGWAFLRLYESKNTVKIPGSLRSPGLQLFGHTVGWQRERLIRPAINSIPVSLKYPFRNKHGTEYKTVLAISLL